MYIYSKRHRSRLKSVEKLEGEPIEHKIERIVSNNEAITDGAPAIYTERKDGIISAYNIRTDRWEVATEGMSLVEKNISAKREGKGKTSTKKEDVKVVDINKNKDGGAESIQGQETAK